MNESVKVFESSSLGAIIKSEIDSQIATAKRYPRSVKQCIDNAAQLATYSKKVAQKCIYFRPVGKKDGKQIFADGESIRLAEILSSCWGNLRVASRSLGMEDGKIISQGICHDLQSNLAVSIEVTKSVRKRNGKMYSDNQIEVAQGAAGAIARRNAILSVVPRVFAQQVMEQVSEKIAGGTEEEVKSTFEKAIKSFGKIGVTEHDLYHVLEIQNKDAVKKENIVRLYGIYNAISDDICTVNDVFGHEPIKNVTVTKPENGDKTEEPQEQSPRQRFNTVNLEYCEKFGAEKADDLISDFQTKFKKKLNDWVDKQLDTVTSRMVDEINGTEK